jgi:hypothetical protein
MASKKMVYGLPLINFLDKFCEGCVIDKHPISSFSKAAEYRAKKPIDKSKSHIYSDRIWYLKLYPFTIFMHFLVQLVDLVWILHKV